MTERSRKSIAERVIARARSRGTAIDDDPEYMAIIKAWIEGEISIQEMRQRYITLLQERSRIFCTQTEDHPSVTTIEAQVEGDSAVNDGDVIAC